MYLNAAYFWQVWSENITSLGNRISPVNAAVTSGRTGGVKTGDSICRLALDRQNLICGNRMYHL